MYDLDEIANILRHSQVHIYSDELIEAVRTGEIDVAYLARILEDEARMGRERMSLRMRTRVDGDRAMYNLNRIIRSSTASRDITQTEMAEITEFLHTAHRIIYEGRDLPREPAVREVAPPPFRRNGDSGIINVCIPVSVEEEQLGFKVSAGSLSSYAMDADKAIEALREKLLYLYGGK